jgi:hypothetical protein
MEIQKENFKPVKPTVFSGAESLAGGHLSNMSEPSEHAIQAEREDDVINRSVVDDKGTPFDPGKHRVNSEGNPVKTAGGAFARKPGRKEGSSPSSSLNTAQAPTDSTQNSGQYGSESAMAAETTVDMIGVIATMFGGESYAYRQVLNDKKEIVIDERQSGIRAFEALYNQKGVTDIPPGVAVLMWAIVFAGTRVANDKQAKSKIKLYWHWLLVKLRITKPAKKEGENKEE